MLVAAHRGDWRNYPENSLMAFQSAIDMGVDIIEVDLNISKDGVVVIMHDQTLDRTTNAKGKPSDYTFEEQWYWLLKDALNETAMLGRVSLDFIKAVVVDNPPVRTRPAAAFSQRASYLRAKRANGWNQYEYGEAKVSLNSKLMNQTMKDDSAIGLGITSLEGLNATTTVG